LKLAGLKLAGLKLAGLKLAGLELAGLELAGLELRAWGGSAGWGDLEVDSNYRGFITTPWRVATAHDDEMRPEQVLWRG
jgi:hypothetical protein